MDIAQRAKLADLQYPRRRTASPTRRLDQSAEQGKSRTAIWRAIKSGKISYEKNTDGHIQIDPAELHRVYPAVTRDDTGNVTPEQNEQPSNTAQLARELEILKAERERERDQLQAMIDQLSRRLDEEAAERRKLTALLTHQHPTETNPPSLWRRLFGSR